MGTLNFYNLAARAQKLLDTIDPDDLDEDTYQGLLEAAAGMLPPGVSPATRGPHPAPQLLSRVREHAQSSQLTTHTAQGIPQEIPQETPTNQQEVTAAEPEKISSDYFKKPKKCSAQNKKSGDPCRAWATHSGYCIFHDPDYTETLREMQARGGSRSPRKVLIGDARRLDVDITDPGGLQALIGHGLRLHLLGALTQRQTSQLTRFLDLLVTNARTLSGSHLQSEAFKQNKATLLQLTDTIVERLEGRDLNDRLTVIEDAGSKREQILKINDRWAPRPTYRSVRDFPY